WPIPKFSRLIYLGLAARNRSSRWDPLSRSCRRCTLCNACKKRNQAAAQPLPGTGGDNIPHGLFVQSSQRLRTGEHTFNLVVVPFFLDDVGISIPCDIAARGVTRPKFPGT